MKNKLKISSIFYLLGVMCLFTFNSCEDWTEIESVDLNEDKIADSNPDLYESYLQSLRAYKKSDHKCIYASFNNIEKVAYNRSHHFTDMPDSLDIVSVANSNLTDWQFQEMAKVQLKKGTKFILTVDYDRKKLEYTLAKEENEKAIAATPEGETAPAEIESWTSFLVKSINNVTNDAYVYGFNGLCFSFCGKDTLHMTEAEKVAFGSDHDIFVEILKDWKARNPEKTFVFAGKPQNLLDKTFLTECDYIVLPCGDAKNKSKLSYKILMASIEGVPGDRYIIAVETTSLDKSDVKTGYFADGVTLAIEGAATWVASEHEAFKVSGLGIMNVNNDYFASEGSYYNVKKAISHCNPSLKN